MKFFQTFLTLREKVFLAFCALGFLALGLLFMEDAKGNSDVILLGLVIVLITTGYWIMGGLLSRQSYLQDSRWQKGKILAFVSFFIMGLLFIGRESAVKESPQALLFDLGFRIMLVGLFLTNQLLLIYARYHGHSTLQPLSQN